MKSFSFSLESSAALAANTEFLQPLKAAFQMHNTQVVLTNQRSLIVDIVDDRFIIVDNKEPGYRMVLEVRKFSSLQDFYTRIINDIENRIIQLIGFLIDDKGQIVSTTTSDSLNVVFSVVMGTANRMNILVSAPPRQRKLEYAPDYISEHQPMTIFELNAMIAQDGAEVIGWEMDKDFKGFIISYRKKSNMMFGNGQPKPDDVWQEQWQIMNGRLIQTYIRKGTHHPAKTINDHVIWDGQWELKKD